MVRTRASMHSLKGVADVQLWRLIIMKECRPSVARNLDFYVKDPKWWFSVQTESTVYTNTEQANWNMPQAKFCLQMLFRGLGSSWVGCVLSWGPSAVGLWVDPDGFSAVDLCQSLPFSRKDWVHLCVIPREMPVGSEMNWPHQGAQEKTGREGEQGGEWRLHQGRKDRDHRRVKHIWKHV